MHDDLGAYLDPLDFLHEQFDGNFKISAVFGAVPTHQPPVTNPVPAPPQPPPVFDAVGFEEVKSFEPQDREEEEEEENTGFDILPDPGQCVQLHEWSIGDASLPAEHHEVINLTARLELRHITHDDSFQYRLVIAQENGGKSQMKAI